MRTLPLLLAIVLIASPAALAQETAGAQQDDGTLLGVTTQTEELSTLAAALDAAQLGDALAGEGPFTVFAPSNDAFAALPEGTLAGLLAEGNRDQLTGILTFHVVSGEYRAADLRDGQTLQTLGGQTLVVSVEDDRVLVNGVEVVQADVEASNGVAHVVSGVLLPPADKAY